MPIDILLTVTAVSVIQSIFGVGVLLFGTPILLLLGYGFVDVLGVLLPVSLTISILQLLRHHRALDFTFYKNVIIYTIPMVVLFLTLVTSTKLNITPGIGILLVLVALKSFFPVLERMVKSIVTYERSYLMAMGLVHGMSNLGGSMLSIITHSKQYPKDKTRVTTAASLATMAVCQLLTLLWGGSEFSVSYFDKISLMQIGTVIFLLTEEMLYTQIDNANYSQLFAVFLLISGLMLVAKSF
jgi:uncharacterized protein